MILCEGIITDNEIKFKKIHQKLLYQTLIDREDWKAKKVFQMFYGMPFKEVVELFSADLRALMSGALQLSIARHRKMISIDLLRHAKDLIFSLVIKEQAIDALLL